MTPPGWLARLLFIVAAFCFLLAAVTAAGGEVFRASAQAWSCGALSAAALGFALWPVTP